MPTQVQWRRGTTAEHSTFTGALGEVTIDTTKKTAIVHDGSTLGGIPLAHEDYAIAAFAKANTGGIFTSDVSITGNLYVLGSTTSVNTASLAITDKNIQLGNTPAPTDILADGGGITLMGTTNKTLNWVDATDSWTSSENLDLATTKTYKINTADVLSATTLGSSVVNSSLTSVGTLTSLAVTGTITTNTNAEIHSTAITTSSVSQVTLDSWSTATYRSGKYDIQITSGSAYHVTELRVVHNGTTANVIQYGDMTTNGSLGTFDASIAGGTLSILFTPTNSSTTVKTYHVLIPT